MKKRLLAIIMTLAMMMSLMPVSVMAAGTTHEVNSAEELGSAISSAASGDIIKLTGNIILTNSYEISSGTITVDLNGQTLTVDADVAAFVVTESGKLVIDDSGNGGKINRGSACSPKMTRGILQADNGGTIEMNGGTIDVVYDTDDKTNNTGWYGVGVFNDSSFVMNGGTINAGWPAVATNGAQTETSPTYGNNANITINNGVLTSSSDYAIYAPAKGGNTTIKGGSITGYWGAIQVRNGTLNVENGTLVNNGVSNVTKPGDQTDGTKPENAAAISLISNYGPITANISGGFITTKNGNDAVVATTEKENAIDLNITGGEFSSNVSDYIGEDYLCTENDDGTWTVAPLSADNATAVVGSTPYKTLAGAMAHDADEYTVTLLKSTKFDKTIVVDGEKAITLNLNGKTAEYTGDGAYALELRGGADLTVTDSVGSGMLVAPNRAIKVGNGGNGTPATLTLNGGTIQSNNTGENSAIAVYANTSAERTDNSAVACEVTVNTATVKGGIYVFGEGAKVTVNEGAVIDANGYYGISGNGAKNGTQNNGGTVIDINGGTITQTYEGGGAIYHPQEGTLNISGNAVITGDSGIQLCSGEGVVANITGGMITATGADQRKDKTGDGFIPDGAAVSVVNRNYPGGIPQMNISGGCFVSRQSKAVMAYTWRGNTASDWEDAKEYFTISGGYFTSDPSAYVAEGKAALPSDTAGYAFMVGNAVQTEGGVEPAVGEPKVDMSLIDAGDKEKVREAAESVTASGELAAAANQAIGEVTEQQKEEAEKAIRAEDSGVPVGDKSVKIYAQTYLDIKPTGYDASAGTMILEIVPMYRVVATTAADAESIQVYDPEAEDNTGANAVALAGSEKELTNIQTMTISITLPDGFPTDNLYVKHMKDNQLVGYHTAEVDGTTVDGRTLTFLNDKGFSTFEIKRDARTAQVKFGDDTLTLTPADVNQDLPTAISAGQVFSGWSFEGINGTYKTLTDDLLTALSTTSGDGPNGVINAVAQFYTPSTGGSTAASYSITVEKAENGTVTASSQSAAKGNAVTITVEPNEGYVLDTLTATDASGNEVALTKVSDRQYRFTMPGSKVTVKATFKADEAESDSLPFTDVNSEDWYYDAVKYAYDNGMMNGMEETLFAPSFNLTRGMLVTILYRLEEDHTYSATLFPDVASDAYYANPVAWASGNGIVKGYEDGTFGPEKNITREQMAQILYNYAVYKGIDTSVQSDLSAFTDGANTSEWAETAMKWAVGNGLLQGYNGQLNPNGTATRAEVAQILMNFCENIAK